MDRFARDRFVRAGRRERERFVVRLGGKSRQEPGMEHEERQCPRGRHGPVSHGPRAVGERGEVFAATAERCRHDGREQSEFVRPLDHRRGHASLMFCLGGTVRQQRDERRTLLHEHVSELRNPDRIVSVPRGFCIAIGPSADDAGLHRPRPRRFRAHRVAGSSSLLCRSRRPLLAAAGAAPWLSDHGSPRRPSSAAA